MTKIKICLVAGARPNFIKIGPIIRALQEQPVFEPLLVHTGQHYDDDLSKVFFDELGLPKPDVTLSVGSGSHAAQTAQIMTKFEQVMIDHQPQVVLVVGDVNSTIGCALVAAKFELAEPFGYQGTPRQNPVIVHVEAGLRSADRTMPEEINRILTDSISDLLYVTEQSGIEHLTREGASPEQYKLVGNVMIDTLMAARSQAAQSNVLEALELRAQNYAVLTLHRPANVDDVDKLQTLLGHLQNFSGDEPIVFPVHPRTQARLQNADQQLDNSKWRLSGPVGYLDFIHLISNAKYVLTDSGGIQEETAVLGVPCITLRENTERPATIDVGGNVLVGTDPEKIRTAIARANAGELQGHAPPLWDGQAGTRIADDLAARLSV